MTSRVTIHRAMDGWAVLLGVVCCLGLVLGPVAPAAAQDESSDESLDELLTQVGGSYAEAYLSPLAHSFGPNQNSNLFTSCSIPWANLKFGFGLKVMAASIAEEDQTFQKVFRNVQFSDFLPEDHDFYDYSGDIVMSGPTVFGDTDTDGTLSFYTNGLLLGRESTIPGLIETSTVPLFAPEAYIGGFYGVKLTIRWFPSIEINEDYGKTKYFGWGLQWNASQMLAQPLPVDVVVGFFDQELNVGSLVETSASSFFIGASKDFSPLTLYAGLAKEKSEMTVSYDFEDVDETIEFTTEGSQKHRLTLGARLKFFNIEVGHGDLTTYSAGLMANF